MSSLGGGDFATIRDLVKRHAAIVIEPSHAYRVETRLIPVAHRAGFPDVPSLAARLRHTPFGPLHAKVVDALTTTETAFFRDLHPFEALRTTVLPDLIRRRSVEKKLSVWCCGSSSGQEPYSIAMLLCEHFAYLRDWTVSLIATDLSEDALDRAREGRFTQLEVNRGLPAPMLVRYFTQDGAEWQIRDEVRRLVEFRAMNLVSPWPPLPPLDVVFLRNVMTYFDLEARREILRRVRGVLQADGTLFLGAAETTLHVDDAFERVAVERSWAYRLRRS